MVSSSIKRFRSVSSRNFVLDHTSPNHNHSSSNNSNSSINCNNDRHHDEDDDSNNDNDNHENHDNHDNHNLQLVFSYVRAALWEYNCLSDCRRESCRMKVEVGAAVAVAAPAIVGVAAQQQY